MDSRLKEWLQNAKSKGYSNDEIKRLLSERSYSEQAIKEIFSSFESYSSKFKKVKVESIKDAANKKMIKVIIGILVIIAISIALFSIGARNNSSKEIVSRENVESIAVIETVVNGNIEMRLPEIKDGKLNPSDKILNRTFQVRFIANGVFIDNYRVLMPSSVIPEEKDIKIKAINELGLLEQVDDDYKNSYSVLSSVSKDIFVIWKEQELVVAKSNVLKTELLGDKGVALVEVRNLHEKYAVLDNEGKVSKKFDVFFKNVTENYEINGYKLSLKLDDKQISGEVPIRIKEKIINGAVAMDDSKILGMLVISNEGIYFINSNVLKFITE